MIERTFNFQVYETLVTLREYTIVAIDQDEARQKAEIGDTAQELDIKTIGVIDRKIADEPPTILHT